MARAAEFNGVTYTKPAGWNESVESGAKIFVPKALKDGELFVVLLTGAAPSNGKTWEKQFEEAISAANDGGKVLKPGKTEKVSGSKLTIFTQGFELDHKDIGKHSRLYIQVCDAKQRTFLTVLMNKDSLVDTYGDDFGSLLASIGFKATEKAQPPATVPNKSSSSSKIPIGNTPRMYMGMVGWRPSGNGLPIPSPAVVGGRPQGIWYELSAPEYASLEADIVVFMPNGQYAIKPRLGGGNLFDYHGQRGTPGETGAGTFSMAGSQITTSYDRYVNKAPFSQGKNSAGNFIKIGGETYYPLNQVSMKTLAGRWRAGSTEYVFKEDGTFSRASLLANGRDAVGQRDSGTYVLDGYLIHIKPANGADWINLIGIGGGKSLLIGNLTYTRS